jgi:hypothetical protein
VRINVLEDTSYVKSDACEEYALMYKVAENIWHNFITCSMRDMVEQDEDGWLMALNWLLSDFFRLLGYGGFESLPSTLNYSQLHEAIQQDGNCEAFREVRLKREQLAKSIYSAFGKGYLTILYLLCGYIQKACGIEVIKVEDNGYRAVASLKNIIKGYDYTEIRRLVPAYIWIKKGMPVLTRNSIN